MALLKRGEYGILSTSDKNNRPYGIPVNYVVMEESIFFHCATEGQKTGKYHRQPGRLLLCGR
jgi:nitroimidazol reductase NimA-like FMN-containing flavoprotein (pyridoxamine 5'-phosphate oxidase superfamily)